MTANNYQVFRRQFYIGRNPKIIDDTWTSLPLNSGLVLSYSNALPVKKVIDKSGKEWVLLGDAIQSERHLPNPEALLADCEDQSNIQDLYKSWANRWVLIGGNELHLDAAGLLGCYYKISDNGVEVATAAGLITGSHTPETFYLLKAGGAEYYPPPDSGFRNVSKLLPSQILHLDTGAVSFRNLTCPIPELSYEQKIKLLSDLLSTTLSNAYSQFGKTFILALTGGSDSRTIMAALNYNKTPYESFTFHRPLLLPADASLPRQLSAISGVKHSLIRRKSKKREHYKKFEQHTTFHSVELDRHYMAYQQFDCLNGDQSVIIRGGGFEVGRCAYYKWMPADMIDGPGISKIQKGNDLQGQSWNKWIDWIHQTPQVQMDWRDRYYIEQRLSGWLSATEQGLDMVNVERLIPANSMLFYSIMLSFSEEIRKERTHMLDMMKLMSPELLSPPINPKYGFIFRQYRRVIMKIDKLLQKQQNNKLQKKILSSTEMG